MNQLISLWLNEAARAAWIWSRWLDSAAEVFSDSAIRRSSANVEATEKIEMAAWSE
ncbi:hypothetical protein [Burkholderia pseudomallei]|uniref:hypothetical protein n=1 Tax=Burkholderia pseudomallei TaxID=28450 RepID=UPI0012F4D4F6|nr:hypothetical protein [Burkholderia pseudomallei]